MSTDDIAVLDPTAIYSAADELADVLVDCVEGGASVSFMLPFSRADAAIYFRGIADEVERGAAVLLAARNNGRICGTVQLGLDTPPNQPHRADVRKLLVHRSARGRGTGAALMTRVEAVAKQKGRTLLVLDTASDAAERLYVRGGWQRVGVIPDYALWPGGGYCDTVVFWKKL